MRILLLPLLLAACAPAGQPTGSVPLRDAGPPSELPPETFTGAQYVDSRGCAYIRAGGNGDITWVPRVDRARQHLCDFEPTLS